jgi:hypothetical protein
LNKAEIRIRQTDLNEEVNDYEKSDKRENLIKIKSQLQHYLPAT